MSVRFRCKLLIKQLEFQQMRAVLQRLTDQDESIFARVSRVGINISLQATVKLPLLISTSKGNSLASRVFREGAIVPDLLSATFDPTAGTSSNGESLALSGMVAGFAIIRARDPHGMRSLVVRFRPHKDGKGMDYMLASESMALNQLGGISSQVSA